MYATCATPWLQSFLACLMRWGATLYNSAHRGTAGLFTNTSPQLSSLSPPRFYFTTVPACAAPCSHT